MRMFKTPKTRAALIALAVVLYLTAPIVEWFYFSNELGRGHYPVNADSIALPLGSFIIGWLIGSPVAVVLLWFSMRSYPGSVSLFGFNRARPYWSLGWSILFAFLVFEAVFFAMQSAVLVHPIDMIQSTLMAYLFLCLRSSIVYGGLSLRNKPAASSEA